MPNELARALKYASKHHRGQTRKGSDVPYVAHLLATSALVLEDGGSEREAIAALLHDVVEDTDVSRRDVRKRFGRKVARIVAACTDVDGDGTHTAKNWMRRRRRMLARLRDTGTSTSVVRVKAADSLANVRSLTADLRRHGPEVWTRFHAGAVDQLWYYRSVAVIVSVRLPGYLADELRVAVHELERVSGWWFDVGDPQAGTQLDRRARRRWGQATRLGRGLERRALLVGGRRRPGAVSRPLRQRDALVGEALLLRVGELPGDRRAGHRIRDHRPGPRTEGSPHASAAALSAARCSSVGGVGLVPSAGRCGSVTPWLARHCFCVVGERLRVRTGGPVGCRAVAVPEPAPLSSAAPANVPKLATASPATITVPRITPQVRTDRALADRDRRGGTGAASSRSRALLSMPALGLSGS